MKRLRRYLWALPVILVAVLVAHLMQPYFDRTNVVMVYMLAVVVVAFRLGGGPAAMACLLSVFLFDFINVPPYFSLGTELYEYMVTLAVMLVTVGIIGMLAGSLRQKAIESAGREARAAALYALSAELAGRQSDADILAATRHHIGQAFHTEADVFRLRDGLQDRPSLPGELAGQAGSMARPEVARLFLSECDGLVEAWLPLVVDGTLHSMVQVRTSAAQLGLREQQEHLSAMVGQCVQAMERTLLRERVHEKELLIQKESLRNNLLNAVSHDLRTPLASIIGASSSLLAEGDSFSPEARRCLRTVIVEEALHMQHMVENLLDMARFQAGDIVLAQEWEALEEIAGSAVAAIRRRVKSHEVSVAVPYDLPFIRCDSVLVERVVINLLENAVKYSPDGSVVTLLAEVREGELEVAVEDLGPGIPEEARERVFGPFVRLHGGSGGGGLGLTICRSIVEAHGGRIRIGTGAGGGARVSFTLPLPDTAPAPVQEAMAAAGEGS